MTEDAELTELTSAVRVTVALPVLHPVLRDPTTRSIRNSGLKVVDSPP